MCRRLFEGESKSERAGDMNGMDSGRNTDADTGSLDVWRAAPDSAELFASLPKMAASPRLLSSQTMSKVVIFELIIPSSESCIGILQPLTLSIMSHSWKSKVQSESSGPKSPCGQGWFPRLQGENLMSPPLAPQGHRPPWLLGPRSNLSLIVHRCASHTDSLAALL